MQPSRRRRNTPGSRTPSIQAGVRVDVGNHAAAHVAGVGVVTGEALAGGRIQEGNGIGAVLKLLMGHHQLQAVHAGQEGAHMQRVAVGQVRASVEAVCRPKD